jgi:DNA repair ATPase RecN
MAPLSAGTGVSGVGEVKFNSEKMEGQLGGMLNHLETMAGSLSSLKALQEVDFSGTSDQVNKLSKFYSNLNEAMANINDSVEDTRIYKEQLSALNENLATANNQMKTVTQFYNSLSESTKNLSDSIEDTHQYKQQLAALNKNLGALNSIYGNILSAMNPGRR